MNKFKNFQKVIIKDFVLNGIRQDTHGIVEGFDLRTNRYIVSINSVMVYLLEDKLEDFEEYWRKKHERN